MEYYSKSDLSLIVKDYMLPLMNLDKIDAPISIEEDVDLEYDITTDFVKNKKNSIIKFLYTVDGVKSIINIETPFFGMRNQLVKETWKEMLSIRKRTEAFEDRNLRVAIYDYTLKKAICSWLSGGNSDLSHTIFRIISSLEKWGYNTNEGEQVEFSIGIKNANGNDDFDFVDFLSNNYSANFTDSNSSGMIVDQSGKFIKYIIADKEIVNISKGNGFITSPSLYKAIISKYLQNKCDYIFILNHEKELMVFKKEELTAVKRCGKWHSINIHSFYDVLYLHVFNKSNDSVYKVYSNEIFTTLLDISLSGHGCGLGIIKSTNFENFKKVIDSIDDLSNDRIYYKHDFGKERLQKRKMLEKYSKENFFNISSIQRKELLSLDGATIIDETGKIYCIGVILKNVSNKNNGGARSAAMNKVAEYGLGIKVSSDGGITVSKKFEEVEVIYAIK